MPVSRRNFLGGLLSSTLAIGGQLFDAARAQTGAQTAAPLITNYNPGNRAALIEGKTLLIALSFPSPLAGLQGSFPIQIEPVSAGGALLTEPQELFFYPTADRRTFRAILSAPLDAQPGTSQLQIIARTSRGAHQQWSFPYLIQRGVYRSTSLTLDENFSSPPPDVAARMRRDFETVVEIYKQRTERRWRDAFIRPVPGADNDNFGVRRTVNQTKRYRHIGLDFKAATGTLVRAMNDGKVVLSTEQWTPGQTVCIDHGGGIFSKYNHLSERRVREGETILRGQVIALSGSSGGQKSPPHLHLDIIVNRTAVDPEDFMRTAAQMVALDGAG
jgi:hypothetical protein